MGIDRKVGVVGVGVMAVWMGAGAVGGCNAVPAFGGSSGSSASTFVGGAFFGPTEDSGVPFNPNAEDNRTVISAPTPPPPISGGTLLVTHDGLTAVAADPDRDRVLIVDLVSGQVTHTVALTAGDEPGRVVEDGARRVHVALRRGGALVTIDIATGAVLARRAVCGAPRGVAYDPAQDQVHVACSGGELVTFAASGGDAVRRVNLGVDLRDIVVQPNGLVVSRFKTAELLYVDAAGNVTSRVAPQAMQRISNSGSSFPPGLPVPMGVDAGGLSPADPISPGVAWRTLGSPDGNVFVLHQYGFDGVINLPGPDGTGSSVSPGFSAGFTPPTSPYGTPVGGCGGLVQPCLSRLGTDGVFHMGMPLIAPVLTLDAAVSPDAEWVAFVSAGLPDPGAPNPSTLGTINAPTGQVSIVPATGGDAPSGAPTGCTSPQTTIPLGGQTIAVAFNPASVAQAMATSVWLVVQSREPAMLFLIRDPLNSQPRSVDLGGASMLDTGHELFHHDAGAGIACVSCHAEGAEDGRVWQFNPTGPRRTQAVHVGLTGTEPFHWDGDMKDFGTLVDEVMVRRMGGATQSAPRKTAMQNWLFSLRPPAPMVDSSDPAALRGQALFDSAAVGCFVCHSGPKLTNNQSLNVGTTDPSLLIQVPSLHGVGYRAPFLHDGRAATLEDRFNPAIGGGDAHGHTSQLTAAQVGDLIAYLESL